MFLRFYKSSSALSSILAHSLRRRMYSGSTPAAVASSQNTTLPFIAELYDPNFLDVLLPPTKENSRAVPMEVDEVVKNPMIEALHSTINQTLTENGAPAYRSTGSATLDAFQALGKYTFGRSVNQYLDDAWKEDAELTLRIIWNLRSIHDGKSEKEAFYRAFGWLYDNHPRTAIQNLHLLVAPVCVRRKTGTAGSHGYWKDLLNIVALATLDQLGTMDAPATYLHCPKMRRRRGLRLPPSRSDESIAAERMLAKQKRTAAASESHSRLLEKLSQPKFRALYIAVARLFSERLSKDVAVLKKIEALPTGSSPVPLYKQISLAAKWAPTPHGSHDRHTNLSTAISFLLHHAQITHPLSVPVRSDAPYPELETLVLRSFYQRWILTSIRKVTLVPEPLMAANRWKEIKYSRVSSVCMKNNTECFYAHDPEGFEAYLTAVEDGKKKISGATLMPHELIHLAVKLGKSSLDLPKSDGQKSKPSLKELKWKLVQTQLRVVEAQWATLIERLRESGSIDNSMAICDVSGSMGMLGYQHQNRVQPIYPAISLSLVLSQLAKPPFNNAFITFSTQPEFHHLDPSKGLFDTVNSMSWANWGMNTDLNKVFLKLLLPLAVKHQVKQEDMIKRLFIFSDMQFDYCAKTTDPAHWETNHDTIEKAYQAAGYEMPQIVYWNLMDRPNVTTPITSDRKGVALMGGFSPAMLKVFMGEIDPEDEIEWETVEETKRDVHPATVEGFFDPVTVMKKALFKKSFEGLVVAD